MSIKTLFVGAAIALSFSAAPAMAQFGSGTSYDPPRKTSQSKKDKKKMEQQKRLEEAKAKQEAMERELMEKERMAQKANEDAMEKKEEMKSYGSGTDEAMEKKDDMKSYGSDTQDGMMKKDDAMMKKDKMMAPANSYGSGTAPGKPANCPRGTTPQDNGTCLLTGGSLPIN